MIYPNTLLIGETEHAIDDPYPGLITMLDSLKEVAQERFMSDEESEEHRAMIQKFRCVVDDLPK